MDYNLLIFFTCVISFLSVTGLQTRDKCKATDSKCLTTAAQLALEDFAPGIPGLQIDPIDPMHVDKISIKSPGVNFLLSNVTVKGLRKCTFDNVGFNMDKKTLTFSYTTEQMTLRSLYSASGRLIILPISGNGDALIKIKQIKVTWVISFEIIKNEQDQDVINLTKYKIDHEIRGGVSFQLTNLFHGNKLLSEPLLEFMNKSWELLSAEFGEPILKPPHEILYQSIKKYFISLPLTDVIAL